MRRESSAAKKMKGTLRPCREPLTAVPSPIPGVQPVLVALTGIPKPPSYLSKGAAIEWKRIAPEVVCVGAAQADMRALALLCESLADATDLRKVIDAEGTTIEAGSGGRKAHPALAALAQSRTQAHKLLTDFGLTPRGRTALPPVPKAKAPNKFTTNGKKP